MKDVLDLNSLSLIEVNINGKLVISEFIEPDKPTEIKKMMQTIKIKLQDLPLCEAISMNKDH